MTAKGHDDRARRHGGDSIWMRGGFRTACAAMLTVALGTAACQQAAPPASLAPDDIATLERADRIINSELNSEEHALINNAHSAVVEACMQRLGWDFEVGSAEPESDSGGVTAMSELEQWTFVDVASAESIGYGLEAYLAEHAKFLEAMENETGARIPDVETMSPEDAGRFEFDYFGTDEERVEIVERDGSRASGPGGGCLGDASVAVYGDIEQQMRLIDARGTAESDIWVATLADEAVNNALNAWKDCVREQGFEFEDPHQAHDLAMASARTEDYDQERTIAATDAGCKAESGLARAVEAAYLAATNAVLPDLEGDLIALQQFEADALARAKDILRLGEQ